jgi:DNA-directed RNA polymerase subunit M/transcription elongation factor TFIIS
MATIDITCPECSKKMKAADTVRGKTVKCKGCGSTFQVKPAAAATAKDSKSGAAKAPAKPAKTGAKSAAKEAEGAYGDFNPYAITSLDLTPRCPHCANELESAESVICLACGYNTLTRELGRTEKTIANGAGDYILWHLPAVACVLGVAGLAVLAWWYCTFMPDLVKDQWYEFLGHGGIRLWEVIMSIAIGFFLGKFAFKRIVLHFHPPEKVKN